MKQKILIFGGTGLLGTNIVYHLQKNFDITLNFYNKKFFFKDVKYANLINSKKFDIKELIKKIEKINPKIIINCAANTNLEFCEKKPNLTKFANCTLPEILSKISNKKNIKFIHFSTDHLYDGKKKFKSEKDKTYPLNNYANQKLIAEKKIVKNNKDSLIIRTNFFGHTIDETKSINNLINSIKKREILKLDDNYFFTPIYTFTLIKLLNKLIQKKYSGIFNLAGSERLSKYKFGLLIADILNIKKPNILKESIDNAKLKATRCKDLSLSNSKIKKVLNLKIPELKIQLKEFFENDHKIKKLFLFKIRYGQHSVNFNDIKYVKKVLQNGPLTQGQLIRETEAKVANYVGSKYAVAVSSATAGLHLSYIALSINKKRRVITSPITFLSTSNAALYCDSLPIFSDIDLDTINLCPSKLEINLKKYNDIGCITPVHFAGLPAKMKDINFLAKKYKLKIVEDAAHALGAKYECGSMVGSGKYSDLCVFSFHPVKIIAGGEGGMITTNSEDLYYKLLKLRTHGINQKSNEILNRNIGFTKKQKNLWYYEMTNLGYHYRQTDIHCALIYSQMDRINKFLEKRNKIAKFYDKEFSTNDKYFLPQKRFRNFSSNHLYTINFDYKKNKITRNYLMSELQKRNIISQVHYIPVPLQYYYKKLKFNMKNLDNALKHYQDCLSLPIYYDLSRSQQKFVIDSVNEILNL